MTDAISRLGVVVEEKGIQETLRGLDKLIVMMEKAEKKASSPLSVKVSGATEAEQTGTRVIRTLKSIEKMKQELDQFREKEDVRISSFKAKEEEKRTSFQKKEEEKRLTIEKAAAEERSKVSLPYEEKRKTYTSKINDDIRKISEKSEKELEKIRLDADSKVRVAKETSLAKIEEAEKRSAANVSAIQQKEREKRITENARAFQRSSLEEQKAANKSEQLSERSNAQIMAIRERTAAFAEKMHLREQAAAERSLKAQQQGTMGLYNLVQGLQGVMTVGFAGFGIQQMITDLIKAADGMTELSARLRLVTSTTAELNMVQQELYKNSQLAGTRIKDNTEIYFGLARSTRNLNISQKDLISLTDGLGKAAIVSGASTESYKSAMVQLRQALESGVLRGQEFNSVNEQAPRIMQAIAEGLGKTTGELRKMAGEGKLTTDVVIPALKAGLVKVNEEYEKLPKTVSRGWNTIENSFLNWIDRANNASGATSSLAASMFSLAKGMDSVSGETIISSLGMIGTAATVVATIFTGKLIGAFAAARREQFLGIAANIEKAKSDHAAAASSARVAEQNVVTAKTELDRANATLLAAERDLAAVAAANSLVLATGTLTRAKQAQIAATANQVSATAALTAAQEANAVASNTATAAMERTAWATTNAGIAMRGLGTVFTMLGGWVTIAIGVIWGLVTIWDKVANAAENAAQAQRDAVEASKRAPTRSEAEAAGKDLQKEYDQLQLDIAKNQKIINSSFATKSMKDAAQRQLDRQKVESSNLRSALTQIDIAARDKTRTLTSQLQQQIEDQKTPEQIAKAYKEGAKYKTPAERRAAEREEAKARYENAKSEIQKTDTLDPFVRRAYQEILADPKRLADTAKQAGVSEETMRARLSGSSTSGAMAKINAVYAAELKAIDAKDKKGGGAGKKPELSAGFESALSYTKEELELLTKLSSAQEKLLGYTVPETLARKQSLEMAVEQENTQTKIAKIQEQLAKKNLGPGVRESLQETLKAYKDRGNAISQELAVTQSLAREQNSLKQYQQETIVPAKQALELEKARAEYAVATGEMSSEEAQNLARLNDLRLIELEYAGQVAEAQKTFNELQSAGYEEAAKNSKKRLDTLVKERDQKLKIAKIKMYQEEDAKSLEAGWKRAWQKYKDEAEDASKLTEKLMTNVLKSIEDAFFNIMSGVKVSFSDLFKSITNDINRYLAQQLTKAIGDSIMSGIQQGMGGISGVAGAQQSGGLSGILGAATTAIKGFGSDILSWVGDFTGSSVISSLSSSVKNASGVINVANPSFVGPIQPFADAGGSSSFLSDVGGSQIMAGIGTAFNLTNSLNTGKGWGSTVGGALGLWNPLAGAVGSVVGGLVDSAFGSKGGPKQGGNYNAAFTSTGSVVAENMFGGYTPSELDTQMQTTVKDLQKNYTDLVKQLGGVAKDLTINLGGDLDPRGTAGNRVSAQVAIGAVGTGTSDTAQAERALWDASLYSSVSKSVSGDFDAAVKLETSRMLVAALRSSDLPADVAKVFEGIDLTNITQSQIDALLAQAVTAADAFKEAEETVKQAAKDLSDILSLFDKWKYVFPNFAKASDEAKKSLSDLAGGLEELSGKMSSYYDNFYSSAEKTEMTWKSISDTLSSAGISVIPKTRAEFRELMESIDITSESGRKMANALLSVESQFADVTESLDDVAKAAIKVAQDNVDEAKRQVQEAYNREADSLRTVIDRLAQFQDQISKFRDSLYLDDTLSPLSNYDKYQFAKSRLEEIQAKALLGDEKALAELEQASRDFLEYSRVYNANSSQYQLDFDAVQSILNRVQISTTEQIDQAKQQLARLDEMVEGILTVNSSVMTLAQAIAAYQAAIAALLAAQGVDVPTIPTPTPTTSTPTGNKTTTNTVAPLTGYDKVYPSISKAYNEYFGRTPTQSEVDYWLKRLGNNASVDQVRSSIYTAATGTDLDYMKSVRQGWIASGFQTLFGKQASQSTIDWWYYQLDYSDTVNSAYKKLADAATGSALEYLKANHPWMVNGSHANGLANVPFDGYLAELHQGERVLTKAENSEYSGSTTGFATDMVAPLLKEIAALRAEVKALKQEVSNQGEADRSQRGVIAETQIKVMQAQAVETIRASNNNL